MAIDVLPVERIDAALQHLEADRPVHGAGVEEGDAQAPRRAAAPRCSCPRPRGRRWRRSEGADRSSAPLARPAAEGRPPARGGRLRGPAPFSRACPGRGPLRSRGFPAGGFLAPARTGVAAGLLRRVGRSGRLSLRHGRPSPPSCGPASLLRRAGGLQQLARPPSSLSSRRAPTGRPGSRSGPIATRRSLPHGVADLEEHLADLARAPLGDLDHPPGVVALGLARPAGRRGLKCAGGDLRRRRALALDHDAVAQAVELRLVGRPLDLDLVGLGAAVAGMGDRAGRTRRRR